MPTPLSLEQRILIAAEYNADRVEVIKELLEDNAIAFITWIKNGLWDDKVYAGYWVKNDHDNFKVYSKTTKELYELYLLQSNKQVKL